MIEAKYNRGIHIDSLDIAILGDDVHASFEKAYSGPPTFTIYRQENLRPIFEALLPLARKCGWLQDVAEIVEFPAPEVSNEQPTVS